MRYMPGAQMLRLRKGAGWVGVSVAFCKGIFLGLAFLCCVGWSALMLFSLPTLAMAGARLWRTSSPRSASGVCVWSGCCDEKQFTEQKRAQSSKEFNLGYLPHPAQLGLGKPRWKRGSHVYMEVLGQGSPCRGDKDACQNSPSQPLPSSLHHIQWTLDPLPQGARKKIHTAAVCLWLPCWKEMFTEALPEKPDFIERAQFPRKWKQTLLTHFTGARLILKWCPPMAWTEVRTVLEIWAHCPLSICTLYIWKPNLSPGTKSALVRASGCPGMRW